MITTHGAVLVVVQVVWACAGHGVPDCVRIVHWVRWKRILAQLVATDVVAIGGILILVLVRLQVWEVLLPEPAVATKLWAVAVNRPTFASDFVAPADERSRGLSLVLGRVRVPSLLLVTLAGTPNPKPQTPNPKPQTLNQQT